MENFAEKVISLLEKKVPIQSIANIFGGFDNFINLISKYPYLSALVQTKLSGFVIVELFDSTNRKYKFELPFIIFHIETLDTEFFHADIAVDVKIPEIKSKDDMEKLFSFLQEYASDEGTEWGTFYDSEIQKLTSFTIVSKINGVYWKELEFTDYDDEDIINIIPKEYMV